MTSLKQHRFFPQKKQILLSLSLGFFVVVTPATSMAASLTELWERMATSEPTLLASLYQARATAERVHQTQADFYPQLNVTANTGYNNRDYQTLGTVPTQTDEHFNSKSAQLNLTQPLWKPAIVHAHHQAMVAKEQAYFQLEAARQELILKLITAWLEDLDARDAIRAVHAVEVAAAQNLKGYQVGYDLHLYAIDQRDEAQAKYQQAVADRQMAESDWFTKHGQLEQLVGALPAMQADYITLDMDKLPYSVDSYADLTRELMTSPAVRAAQLAWQTADAEVRKQTAGHQPTVELVASAGYNSQPDTGTIPSQAGFRSQLRTISVQLNWPLYTGGEISSKVREARYQAEKAHQDMESVIRTTQNQAVQAWAQLRSAQAKIEAARQRVTASKSFQQVAINGQKSQTKTLYDELYAQQQLETGYRDARRAYYDNIIGMAKLLLATGQLSESSLADIQSRMRNPRAYTEIPRPVFDQEE
jgi:outer membrane protein